MNAKQEQAYVEWVATQLSDEQCILLEKLAHLRADWENGLIPDRFRGLARPPRGRAYSFDWHLEDPDYARDSVTDPWGSGSKYHIAQQLVKLKLAKFLNDGNGTQPTGMGMKVAEHLGYIYYD